VMCFATSSRDQAPPNKMARHPTLRRETASALAKMQRRLCILGVMIRQEVQRSRMRAHHYVGARRPCTALLGQRVREWNARNVIAPTLNG